MSGGSPTGAICWSGALLLQHEQTWPFHVVGDVLDEEDGFLLGLGSLADAVARPGRRHRWRKTCLLHWSKPRTVRQARRVLIHLIEHEGLGDGHRQLLGVETAAHARRAARGGKGR